MPTRKRLTSVSLKRQIGELGLALCSLPRTNPGNRLQYKRTNGPYKLVMIAGADCKLPYGNLPRLLLAWVSTEAVRTQSRELVLGRSLAEFMRPPLSPHKQPSPRIGPEPSRARSGEAYP